MYVKIRSLDGSKNCVLVLSKQTLVKKLKKQILDSLDVPVDKQRLFYKGKHLEDQYSLYDYSVNLNDVIQLMIKQDTQNESSDPGTSTPTDDKENVPSNQNKNKPDASNANNVEEFVDLKPAESKYYEVGNYVDAIMEITGSWFEAEIKHILVDVNKDSYDENDLVFNVLYLKYKDDNCCNVSFDAIRPLPKSVVTELSEDLMGVRLMGNYNRDDPNERGYWHDMLLEQTHGRRIKSTLTATVYFGKPNQETELDNCKIKFVKELYKIETRILRSERTAEDEKHMTTEPKTLRQVVPECSTCEDIESDPCKECGCNVCAGKGSCDKLILCEECQHFFHLWCVEPPLDAIPEDDWFCPDCKLDTSEVITPGQKLKKSKKKARGASSSSKSTREWGNGMACVGRTKTCEIVPPNHFGPIPGIEVGQTFLYRNQASEAGVHRPPVSGISGRQHEGAYSIVLSGGYEDDVDDGETFEYTGSGGRDLSGNKRTSCQSFDQKLTLTNLALARNCNAKIDDKNGAEAIDWRKGKPVRVMRKAKTNNKHSKYAPEEGYRYDGIYKVRKYFPVKGKTNFIVWKYVFERDDEIPAPWTEEGKQRIKDLGLQMILPEGYEEAQAAKEANKSLKRKEPPGSETDHKEKKSKQEYSLPSSVVEHIESDTIHSNVWNEIKSLCKNGQKEVLEHVQEKFCCIICQDLVFKPVTLDCVHSFCSDCLKRAFKIDSDACNSCPYCRNKIDKSVLESHTNDALQNILSVLFPGYSNGR